MGHMFFRSIKLAAKKGDNDSAKILAKEVVHARKSVAKIYTAKANLSSVEMQIKQQARGLCESNLLAQCIRKYLGQFYAWRESSLSSEHIYF